MANRDTSRDVAPSTARASLELRGSARTAPPAPTTLPLDPGGAGPEHRDFPRARLTVPFALWIGEGEDRTFSASLRSVNLSVSGAFLQSSFFLPVGTELSVSFQLEPGAEVVRARAQVVREERPPGGDPERSGMGMLFVEFFGQTEVTLARLFLGQALRQFAEAYLESARAQAHDSELDRVVDALAAWELQKVSQPGHQDPWRAAPVASAPPAVRPGRGTGPNGRATSTR